MKNKPIKESYYCYMSRMLALLLLSSSSKAQEAYKAPSVAKYHLATCRIVKNVLKKLSFLKLGNLNFFCQS
jgi:hypothetical protein